MSIDEHKSIASIEGCFTCTNPVIHQAFIYMTFTQDTETFGDTLLLQYAKQETMQFL